MDNPLQERGKAMEDSFFAQQDKRLLEKLREEMVAEKSRQSLTTASGIEDPAVIDALLANQITPETLTTMGLVPLIAVAWADGKMDAGERKAILQAAEDTGIEPDSVAFAILENWLDKQPPSDLLDSWKQYISALKLKMEPAAMNQLKTNLLDRAETVAESAGGFLGLVNTVSAVERKMLGELAAAFE